MDVDPLRHAPVAASIQRLQLVPVQDSKTYGKLLTGSPNHHPILIPLRSPFMKIRGTWGIVGEPMIFLLNEGVR